MRTLPDYLRPGMKLVVIGSNPSERSARLGHYYAGRSNQFWALLYEAGVVPEPLSYEDDQRLLEFGIGLTDLVKRPTRGIELIEPWEFAEGGVLLAQKLAEVRPRMIAFNGKTAYAKFAGRPSNLGLQEGELYGARVFVLPSTSGENAGLTHAEKLRYFQELGRRLADISSQPRNRTSPAGKKN